MLYLRLARGGIVEVLDGVAAERDEEFLTVKAADGRVICRLNRLDVLAFSTSRKFLEDTDSTSPDANP